jgi:hypothetical protein
MRRALLFTAALTLAACGDNRATAVPDAAPLPAPLHGGSITLAGCGYDVTTRDGAAAPAMSTPVLGADPTPRLIHLGLRGDARTSVVVSWRTADETTLATTVEWGKSSTAWHSTDGFSYQYESNLAGDRVRQHETHLCGLEPDTSYTYRVGGKGADGTEVWSPTYSFRTAPDLAADPSAQVTFLILGDSRDGAATFGQLLAKGVALGSPDLLVFTGDAVTIGALQDEWDQWLGAGEPVMRTLPMIATLGNHEANAQSYYAQLALPGDEENFSLDYGAVHLTVVNDTPEDTNDLDGKIPAFLDSDLAAHASAPWLFVMHHRGAYSSALFHGSDLTLRSTWCPIYDAHHVDLVLNGHDHDYERSLPVKNAQVVASAAEGTYYVVAGSAGADLYQNSSDFWTATSASTHAFVLLHVRKGQLDFTTYDLDGTAIDDLSITKP